MALEHTGRSRFLTTKRGGKRLSRKVRGNASQYGNGRILAVEELEARWLLVTRVWLDFGDFFAIPTSGIYAGVGHVATNIAPFTNALVGNGIAGDNHFFDSFGLMGKNIADLDGGVHIVSTYSQLAGFNSGIFSPTDFVTLELAITAQIQRALEPYDIQVYSSVDSNVFNFPANPNVNPLTNASALEGLNNTAANAGLSPGAAGANTPQYGSNDIYIFFGGLYTNVMGAAVPLDIPMSADFAVDVPNSQAGVPQRMDTGGIVDVNAFMNQVLGGINPAGSLNVAMANAAMYIIGWDLGLAAVENGASGPFTNYSDTNVALINQASGMIEGGYQQSFFLGTSTLSLTNPTFFPRFPMMQNGENFQPLLRQGTLGNPPLLDNIPFPLPPQSFALPIGTDQELQSVGGNPIFTVPDATINHSPTTTVNAYDELVNDSDVGANPDVAYVSGTGAFDQITITKINATQARVLVNAFTDDTYTTLATDATGVIASYSYIINLSKILTPGRLDDGQPFRIVVDGTTNDDQIYLDPTLGVNVEIHGGGAVKFVQLQGNGAYNVQYTPSSPPEQPTSDANTTLEGRLIPETLLPGAGGTLMITGNTSTTSGTKTTLTPFTTTIIYDHFSTANSSAIRLDGFNKFSYVSPGYLDDNVVVSTPSTGFWSLGGQIVNPSTFATTVMGAIQLINVKSLDLNTTLGPSNDTFTFQTNGTSSLGMQSVSIEAGTGTDTLDFDDSAGNAPLNYEIGPGGVQLVPAAGVVFGGFSGYTYSGIESLSVEGTTGNNQFIVTPSATTSYTIDGEDPPPGTLPPDGDTLALRLSGTTAAVNTPAGPGAGTITFGSGQQSVTYNNIEIFQPPPTATTPPTSILAVAAAAGGQPLVKVYNATTHAFLFQIMAYAPSFKGGVQVITADLTGDGTPDIITAPGPGTVPSENGDMVKVFNGVNGAPLVGFFPELASYKMGLYIAAGNVDGVSGDLQIVVSTQRGVPDVRVFDVTKGVIPGIVLHPAPQFEFSPYPKTVATGVQVAVADTDGDGVSEIITAPGPGNIATVKVFTNFGALLEQFNAFETTFKGGVSLAAGDVDGDGRAEIVVGAGTSGGSRVRVFDAIPVVGGVQVAQFQAYTTNVNAPVRITLHDAVFGEAPLDTGVHAATIYAAQGIGGATHDIRVFDPLSGGLVDHFLETNVAMKGGVNLG